MNKLHKKTCLLILSLILIIAGMAVAENCTLIMTWTDESNEYVPDQTLFETHLQFWGYSMYNHPRQVYGGCFVVNDSFDYVLPPTAFGGDRDHIVNYLTNYDLKMSLFNYPRGSMPLSAFQSAFALIMNPSPVEIILLVDDTGSMDYNTLASGYNQFVNWLSTTYPNSTIHEVAFSDYGSQGQEYWLKYMGDALNSI